MQLDKNNNEYPIKITCHTAQISRLRKLRASWFIAGVLFSVAYGSVMNTTTHSPKLTAKTKENRHTPVMAIKSNPTLEKIINASPEEFIFQLPHGVVPTYGSQKVAPPQNPKKITTHYSYEIGMTVEKGDTFIDMLTDKNIAFSEAQSAFNSMRKVFDPRKLKAGDIFTLKVEKDDDNRILISELEFPISSISTIKLSRTGDNSFDAKKIDIELTKKLVRVSGTINSSIYQTAAEHNVPFSMINEIVNAYSYDVDFQRDVKKGDSIDILFERMEAEDGTVKGNGNFLFSELTLGKRSFKVYRHTNKDGITGFYNEKGESVRKGLLRTPINGARITSKFGKRRHPILGYTKMHRGIDFGAPTGTPIYAAGDGIVKRASRNGGYGKYLKIQHNKKYATAYAHLSRYAKGISAGKRVKQGQIVAYVGSTGASTGPHLHYEILANNRQVNPANVKFKSGNSLRGKELAAFRNKMDKIEKHLASIKSEQNVTLAKADE